jgi:Uma2 family endonuclease
LRNYAAVHGGVVLDSPIDIIFSEYNVLQPDVLFFRRERQHLVNLDAPIRHAPDLCVEVVSASTAATDRGRKMQMYARYGVSEYWIVDPLAQSIEVYQLSGEAYALVVAAAAGDTVQSPTVEGLTFTPSSVFPAE